MIQSIFPFLLPCIVLLTQAGFARSQDRATKVYDVRYLLAPEALWKSGKITLPTGHGDEVPTTGLLMEQSVQALDATDLVHMLSEGLGPTRNGAGEPLLKISGNLLFATATAEEHLDLANWIDLCQQLFLEPVTIEAHLLPAKALAGAKGRMLRDEVEGMLRTAGPHPVFTCSTRVGCSALLRSDDATSYVRDYDVEVAQKSNIYDPKIAKLVNGRLMSVTTSRCADGRLLVHVDSQASRREERVRTLDIPHRDQRGKRQLAPVQLPVVHFVEESASGRLADGDALLFGSDATDETLCCLRIRRPTTIPMPSGADWSWHFASDLTAPRSRCTVAHLRLQSTEDDAPLFAEPTKGEAAIGVSDLQELMEEAMGNGNRAPGQVIRLPRDVLRVRGPEAARKAVNELLLSLSAALTRDLTVELRCGKLATADAAMATDGRLDVGELAGRLPTTLLTGVVLDHDFQRTAITQRAHMRDYEVEIAQEASISNPVIGSIDTGISIRGGVTAAGRDRYRLRLDISFAELAGELEVVDLKDEDFGPVELGRVRTATFQVSPLVETKRWTVVYLAPLQGTSEHFVCVARVRE